MKLELFIKLFTVFKVRSVLLIDGLEVGGEGWGTGGVNCGSRKLSQS